MRYAVISKGLSLDQIKAEAMKVGARDIRVAPLLSQVFCEMTEEQAGNLAQKPGLKVKPVGKVAPDEAPLIAPPAGPPPASAPRAATVGGLNLYDTFNNLRQLYRPQLDGAGLTVALIDSGIRETHEALVDKVVHRANFSESETMQDVFGHGTGVAYVIAGEYGERSGVAPGAKLMNLKALNDDGVGTDEMVVGAIEEVCELVEAARNQGLHPTDPMYPNTINLSLGSDDDGDPDNPMRVACRIAVEKYGLQIIAAAGNSGPKLTTIMNPACDPKVVAVGGIKTWEFDIWEQSSRGPTKEGLTKPDFVCWAESIEVASHRGDSEYDLKSGTSFTAPILTGVDGLLWDLCRRVYGIDVRVTYYDWAQFAYAYCVKPEGAPVAKDNTYGYGVPAVGVMVQRLMRPAMPVTAMMETMIPMVLLMGMMPMIIKGV
jgi:serine protease AprX